MTGTTKILIGVAVVAVLGSAAAIAVQNQQAGGYRFALRSSPVVTWFRP